MTHDKLIPVARPWITEREGELARDAALNAWGVDHYKYNKQFEEMFAAYIGRKYAISLPHATAGLHLALAAHGVGSGDEVIVPDVTWIASSAPISYVGATPIFVDILADTWCLDPQAVEAAITPNTKAIIGVDLYGSVCNWAKLKEIAERHNIILIEDAAEALGSEMDGRKAGAFGSASIFSFHGSKTLVTGEGGMLVTDDDDLHELILCLRDHGRPLGDRLFQNSNVAFKYKMSAMQAAIGIAQMERVEELVAYKRENFKRYSELLVGQEHISLNAEPKSTKNSYWMVTVVQNGDQKTDKFNLQRRLRLCGIDTRPFFSRLSTIEAYKAFPQSSRFLSEELAGDLPAQYGLNLPSGYGLTDGEIKYICETLLQITQSV
ncbi:DegT/DnrJ/EryC1/StrS family aminotransferase [Lentilitoribacter sp. EG35]|jgi:perosamine synthetase|uniref:DegT/DnrJ/EryC1/StrS family aminotransferase n=1 Tax=Lentilitoribacter sp. EG35 TaxID=3234192 RepID=UPI00345F61AA